MNLSLFGLGTLESLSVIASVSVVLVVGAMGVFRATRLRRIRISPMLMAMVEEVSDQPIIERPRRYSEPPRIVDFESLQNAVRLPPSLERNS
jgi:hypothetical protein